MACVAISGQEIVLALGLGRTSVEPEGSPVTPETLFGVGSVTKPLTGAAILRLADAGKVDLDAPVREYIPWLEFSSTDARDQITPRMLLTHTSGLPTDMKGHGTRDPRGLAEFLRAELARYPLVARPGTAFSYSNLGFSVLGHIAEVVAGQTYSSLMHDLVFSPLDMNRTMLDPTLAAYAPAGLIFSTALDLANFARMQLANGRFRSELFLSPESALGMVTVQTPTYTAGAGGWGLATFVDPHPRNGLPRAGHMGAISGYRAVLEVYPTLSAAVIVLMNRAGDHGAIRDILLEECLEAAITGWSPPTIEPNRVAWPDYTGTYLSDEAGLVRVTIDADELLLEWNGDRLALNSLATDHYASAETRGGVHLGVGFIRGSDRRVEHLLLSEKLFSRVQPVIAHLHRETWSRYEGSYALKQPPMSVRVANGSLFLHSAFYGHEVHCVPLSDVEFACQWGRFSFRVDANGRTEGIDWAGTSFIPRL